VEPGFAYESGRNPHFLTVEQLRTLIAEHVPEASLG
jgi:UDP-N-acetylglucosamine 4,6-dehydratase